MSGSPYQPRQTGDGSWTLYSRAYGQSYHSRSGAWKEAEERYLEPCRIIQRAQDNKRMWILDVGFGLGYNVVAALDALIREAPGAEVYIQSLEQDEELLRRVAAGEFPGGEALPEAHRLLRAALEDAIESGDPQEIGPGFRWTLHLGDAREQIEQVEGPMDAIFQDPFSPRANPELWTVEWFQRLARLMAPQGILSTYSAAVQVRANMLAADLRIGEGGRVGSKAQGTLASPERDLPPIEPRKLRSIERRASGVREQRE